MRSCKYRGACICEHCTAPRADAQTTAEVLRLRSRVISLEQQNSQLRIEAVARRALEGKPSTT